MRVLYISVLLYSFTLFSCSTTPTNKNEKETSADSMAAAIDTFKLPKPYETKSTNNFSKVIGWDNGRMPIAPAGFTVTKYADSLKSIRWIYVLPNGDVLVSQANTEPSVVKKVGMKIIGADKTGNTSGSPNCITLLRDTNKDGFPEIRQLFLSGLNQPLGMTLIGNSFYVAVTDGVWKYPYKEGDLAISAPGKKILSLPAGGYNNHWTRNLLASKDGSKIYISVGSASNVAEYGFEEEFRRANILEINPDGTGERVYASGLRNPVGMAWAPGTNVLWTAVNERDLLGDDLVPDYITSVKDGGFYGWPYSYIGKNLDPRIEDKDQRLDLVEKTLIPDVLLGSHTASLGLTFYEKNNFPEKYLGGAFIGQHGSWNRKELAGYKVLFIPFRNGKPAGMPEDFLTGFVADLDNSKVYGRPAGVAVASDGSLLVADDASNVVWKVSAKK